MVTISMTLRARINIGYLVKALPASIEDGEMWDDVFRRMKPTEEEAKVIRFRENKKDGVTIGTSWQEGHDQELESITDIELETEHAKRLLEFLKNWGNFNRLDLDNGWPKSVVKQLKDAL